MDLNSTTLTGLSGHDQIQNPRASSSYVLNGKIMLCSVIVLFVVVVILICFRSYTRWLCHRRQGDRQRHRYRRSHQLFVLSSTSTTNSHNGDSVNNNIAQTQALDIYLLKRIPTFVYSSDTHDRFIDCAVCLSEFVDDEMGRVLPTCRHAFHADCIDMWFRSHSDCPLCRTPVQFPPVEEVVSVTEPAGSVSERELGYVHQMACSSSSSSSSTSLPPLELLSVLVEIPRGDFTGLDDMVLDSNNGGNGFRFAGNRVLTLSRFLSV